MGYNYILFSVFTSRPTSLLASNTATVFSLMVFMFYSINVVSTEQKLDNPFSIQRA